MDASDWLALGSLVVSGIALWLAWRSHTRVEREEAPNLGIEVVKYEVEDDTQVHRLHLSLRVTNRSRLPDGIEWITLRQSNRESDKVHPSGAEFDARQMGRLEVPFIWSTNPGLAEGLQTGTVPALEARVKTVALSELKVVTVKPASPMPRPPA